MTRTKPLAKGVAASAWGVCLAWSCAALAASPTARATAAPDAPTVGSAQEIPAPLALEWCLERARNANPSLAGAVAAASAASHRVSLSIALFLKDARHPATGSARWCSTPTENM